MKKLMLLLVVCFWAAAPLFAEEKDPIGVLFQVKGKVEYTKNGSTWSDVRRSKFLFNGYQIKTGADGSGKVTIKETGENLALGPNALVKVTDKGLVAQQGAMTAVEASGQLASGLMQKFSKSQSYTTVRRSAATQEIKIDAVREIALTDNYPYIVWDNIGSEYGYKVSVGDTGYEVPATAESYVRLKVNPFQGEGVLKISAIKNGVVVTSLEPFKSRGQEMRHTIKWLNGKEKEEVDRTVKDIQETYGEDSFMLGSYFEKKDMWVASMDQYKRYLTENPDEIEMTPYLFRVYKKLKLEDVYQKELEAWKAAMIE